MRSEAAPPLEQRPERATAHVVEFRELDADGPKAVLTLDEIVVAPTVGDTNGYGFGVDVALSPRTSECENEFLTSHDRLSRQEAHTRSREVDEARTNPLEVRLAHDLAGPRTKQTNCAAHQTYAPRAT